MKTLIITGVGPGSIGFETCRTIIQTQKHNPASAWNLILAQREPLSDDSHEVLEMLKACARGTQCKIIAIDCDLANSASIRSFASRAKTEYEHIHVLILNAATITRTFAYTVDGNEHMQQDRLKERVIFVSSSLHKKADARATLGSLSHTNENAFDGMTRYAQSKLLTAYCLPGWHKILQKSGVKVILASPGFVPTTKLNRQSPWLVRLFMSWIIYYMPFARTTVQAGNTIAALAVSQDHASLDNVYVQANLQPAPMHDDVYVAEHADKVWQWSLSTSGAVMSL